MNTRWLVLSALVGPLMLGATSRTAGSQSAGSPLATPLFHHVHQNSTDPAAAIALFQTILHRGHLQRAEERSQLPVGGQGRHEASAGRRRRVRPVSLNWFVSQSDAPLAPTRGQLVDHIAVSVPALDPWIAKLKAENVTFLQQPYSFGDVRAIMIEGPSREAIESNVPGFNPPPLRRSALASPI